MSRAFVSQSLSTTALCLFAAVILAASLISSNRSTSAANQRFSTLQFYVGREVLPDHPLYVLLMARDRVQLWLANDETAPRLRLRYAEKRFRVARALAAQNKIPWQFPLSVNPRFMCLMQPVSSNQITCLPLKKMN